MLARGQVTSPDSASAAVTVWYGPSITFGRIGVPQPVVNIPGRVAAGKTALEYSLNGGATSPLSIGPDTRRLSKTGDFNIDLPADLLLKSPATNSVRIIARDSLGDSTAVNVAVTDERGNSWPLPYDVNWSTPQSLTDSAQVVDGLWGWTAQGIMPLEPGYDRLVAIGDTSWRDYEVTADITVLSIDSSDVAYDDINGGPCVGLLMRWNGHTNTPAFSPPITQPKSGYIPFGAIGWYHWRRGQPSRWELCGNNLRLLGQDTVRQFEIGIPYRFKIRVTTSPTTGDGIYSFKAWKTADPEPADWQFTGEETTDNPLHGSMLLVAHHAQAVYGHVAIISPYGDTTLPAASSIRTVTGATSAYVTWNTDIPTRGKVRYGTSAGYGSVASSGPDFSTSHAALLTGLRPVTAYHFAIVSASDAARSDTTADSTLTTPPSAPFAFHSGRFAKEVFDSTRWAFINPPPASTLSFVNQGGQEVMAIAIPGGSSHDIWDGMHSPRIMQPAHDMDFEAVAEFSSELTAAYQIQGVLVDQDDSLYARFDFVRDSSQVRVFAATFNGPLQIIRGSTYINPGKPLYLRIRRSGSSWSQAYSRDSLAWTESAAFSFPMIVNAIGVFSGNAPAYGDPAPGFTGITDFLVNVADPLASVNEPGYDMPARSELIGNYPNPFNPSTIIKYTVAGIRDQGSGLSDVKLTVYDILGREVTVLVNERKAPGTYTVRFDGSRLASGVYIYRLTAGLPAGQAGSFSQSRTMVLIK